VIGHPKGRKRISRRIPWMLPTLRRLFAKRNPDQGPDDPLTAEVRRALEDVRVYARSHGGDIELVSVSVEGDVRIKLRGACSHCPLSSVTIKVGVEQRLREAVPVIQRVLVV
jgi:Fe-S cluster biogenesis protein NfuA